MEKLHKDERQEYINKQNINKPRIKTIYRGSVGKTQRNSSRKRNRTNKYRK